MLPLFCHTDVPAVCAVTPLCFPSFSVLGTDTRLSALPQGYGTLGEPTLQRWRHNKRQQGLKHVSVWLTEAEELGVFRPPLMRRTA